MEKGTREFRCPGCLPERTILRIRITAEVYGKFVKILCPKCLQEFWVEIPIPAPDADSTRDFSAFPFGENPFDLFGDLFKKK